MSRRLAILFGLFAASGAALLAVGPPLGSLVAPLFALLRDPPPAPPPEAATLIDDPTGALLFARDRLADEVDRFGRELGVELRIVATDATADPEALQALAEERLAQPPRPGAWYAAGRVVVVVPRRGHGVALAADDAVEAAAPPELVQRLVVARTAPFVGEPLVGPALASSLTVLRDHLMGRAAEGALPLHDVVRAGSLVTTVTASEPARAARCAGIDAAAAGAEPAASVEAFVCALAAGPPDPGADLFTAASRVHLERRPWLAFESRVRAALLDAQRPWSVSTAGARAALEPGPHRSDFPPVLLAHEEGVWRVDLVEMGKIARPVRRHWRRTSFRTPYWLALGASREGELEHDLSPIELWGEDPADAVARLERSEGAAAKARLAEILLRNLWLPGEALLAWEEALALAPDDAGLALVYADRAEQVGHPLLGAIALAPFGADFSRRVAELMFRAGEIEVGATVLRHAGELRKAREARRARPSPPGERAI